MVIGELIRADRKVLKYFVAKSCYFAVKFFITVGVGGDYATFYKYFNVVSALKQIKTYDNVKVRKLTTTLRYETLRNEPACLVCMLP